MTTPAPWETVDPALINPRAVRLVEALKDALASMRDEHGLTFDDLHTVSTLLTQMRDATGVPLSLCAMPLFSEAFQGGLRLRPQDPQQPRHRHPVTLSRKDLHVRGLRASTSPSFLVTAPSSTTSSVS